MSEEVKKEVETDVSKYFRYQSFSLYNYLLSLQFVAKLKGWAKIKNQ